MNKLLQHLIDIGDVNHKFLPFLQKMQTGGRTVKVQDASGRVQEYNTASPEYKRLYEQGIGSWLKFDEGSRRWVSSDASDPNAEFVTSPKQLSEIVVTGKARPQRQVVIPDLSQRPNYMRGDMESYFPQIERMRRQPEIDRLRAEQVYRNMPTIGPDNRTPVQRQADEEANTGRSPISKGWAVLTNPMTALRHKMPYWSTGRQAPDLPDNFDRGERNNLDMAVDILNPFGYLNAAGNVVGGIARVAKDPFSIGDEAMGILGNALYALPAVGEGIVLSQFLRPGVRTARQTFRATSDLPLRKRISNAINSGTLEYDMPGDVTGHSYFSMSPEEVSARMADEITNLPKGSYTVDKSMSKNSAPLYWTQAARTNPKEFTIIRPGTSQSLNWAGTQGRRVVGAVPEDASKFLPEFQQIADEVSNRINFLRQMNTPESLRQAARLEKEGIGSALVAEIPRLVGTSAEGERMAMQFMNNYKPFLDNPIARVNERTGLNFPMTSIKVQPNDYLPLTFEQPTIMSLKGSPLRDRFLPALRNYAKERAERLYLGDMFSRQPRGSNFRGFNLSRNSGSDMDLPDPPEYIELKKGGPIVDPRGQWAHPGKRTIVPTSTGQITMKGVPYPVYGQDETGFGQMMYPGGEYTFPGQMVDEIPMMGKGGQHGGLDRWFAEKWVDVKTGKPCGRQEGESRAYPACRPSRRVSSQTPKTASEMSPAEKAKFKRSKTSSERINYNHKRMQEGGMLPQYQMRGQVMSTADSVRHQANKILLYEQLRGGPGGTPLPQYADPKYMSMLMNNIYPQVRNLFPNASAMEAAEAMDFIFNAGRDPRIYMLDQYLRSKGQAGIPNRGSFNIDMNKDPQKWAKKKPELDALWNQYASEINKLPVNTRRQFLNKGRDWYYQNINNPSPGVPSSDYYDTWYGRIWNTNDFLPFNPNNPNFKPKKK